MAFSIEEKNSEQVNNKSFIFKCLKALEAHGKVEEIHTLLTNPDVAKQVFGITWTDNNNIPCPIIKALLPGMDKTAMQKANNGNDVYYTDTINLDGIEYLVYNNCLDKVRKAFFIWTKNIIFPELEEIEEIITEVH